MKLLFKACSFKAIHRSPLDTKLDVVDYADILTLIKNALTDKIADREIFMKGIDYSYYYEEEN